MSKRCVATPGPRYEVTVSRIDLPNIFEPGGNILFQEYGCYFPRNELPPKLVNAYPELMEKEPAPKTQEALPDYVPTRATSPGAPTIFYLEEGPKSTARLSDLFAQADHRRCPLDLLIRGTPAPLVVRPVRYTCHCGRHPRRGVKLQLLAIKLAPHAMGLPTYQDFLAEEDADFEERVLEGGHDY